MSHSSRLRVGAVSYLNTKPLVYRLEQIAPDTELVYDLPSRLADDLAAGQLDVALIPSVEAFQDPSYTVVSDACIACRGPVLSVKLLSRKPAQRIETLALDEGSRTSAALVRILLQQRFGLTPQLETLPIGRSVQQTAADAVLLIGDRAIHAPQGEFIEQWDLGEQWCRWSGLPFVFAMWTTRCGTDLGALPERLEQARDAGVAHLRQIAEAEAPRVGLSVARCSTYLQDHLHFYLGREERQGLEHFRTLASQLALVAT